MNLFYQPELANGIHELKDEEARHCATVLRLVQGDTIHVTNGLGLISKCTITSVSKKKVAFEVVDQEQVERKGFHSHIAIAPTKQMERMEWFVEKACEMGVDEISFVLTKNSERTVLKLDRLEKKAISALKQSKGGYKTKINALTKLDKWLPSMQADMKCIAAIDEDFEYLSNAIISDQDTIILIGPEGDFTTEELASAKSSGFIPISMGKKILRTETAGVAAACAINLINQY